MRRSGSLSIDAVREKFRRISLAVGLGVLLASVFAIPASAAGEWEIQPTVNPEATQSFENVSCNTAGLCMAVGARSSGPLAEIWDGGEWKVVATSTGAKLNDVACIFGGVSECGAVGSKSGQAWGQRWSKATGLWTPMSTPAPAGATSSEFLGAGCAPLLETKLECLGVGTFSASGVDFPLAMRWETTTQKFVLLETPSEGEGSVLNDTSCNVVGSCVAVGYYLGSESQIPLAMHWDGSEWTIVSVPNSEAGGTDTRLNDVACTGTAGPSTRCIAVGVNEGGGARVAVGMYWNGEEWSEVAPEEPAGLEGDFAFHSVSCVSGSECYAVGEYEAGGATKTLIEEWDGLEWAPSSSPNPEGSSWSGLSGVSCVAASADCVAAGSTESDTLAMHQE